MKRRRPEKGYRHQPTEAEVCPLCSRAIPPSQRDRHHLVPKLKGGRETLAMHRMCHRQIHMLFSEAELARRYSTIEALLEHEDVRAFVEWIRTKPDDFNERTRLSRRLR